MTLDARGARVAVRTLAALVVTWVLVGCAASSPEQSGDVPHDVESLHQVCDGTPYRDAPAYQGAGPHATYLVNDFNTLLIREWGTAADAAAFELVGCVDHVGKHIDDCSYIGMAAPVWLVDGDLRIRLLEIRTGRQIGEVTVPGVTPIFCPIVLNPNEVHDGTYYGPTAPEAVNHAIDPYVSQTVAPYASQSS